MYAEPEENTPTDWICAPETTVAPLQWPSFPDPVHAQALTLACQARQAERQPIGTVALMQRRQIRSLLGFALKHVPYYQERYAPFRSSLAGDFDADDFRDLPILRKADVQSHFAELRSRFVPRACQPLKEVSTSGSTGQPLRVMLSRNKILQLAANEVRRDRWQARDYAGVEARLTINRTVNPQDSGVGSWSRIHRSGPQYFFPGNRTAAEHYDWLRIANPNHLVIRPEILHQLVRYSERRPHPMPNLRSIMTLGFTLRDDTRELVEGLWGVKVFNTYGAEEVGYIAMQCPGENHLHVLSDAVHVEVLHEDGRPCESGEIGRVVLTDLQNLAMPLIRYEIGDYAQVGNDCPHVCGLPVLQRIAGRQRSLFITSDGRRFFPGVRDPFYHVARHIPRIRRCQLVQQDHSTVVVRVVADGMLDERERAWLVERCSEAFEHRFTVSVQQLESIPLGASGKFEDAISLVANDGDAVVE